jgi:hypothetical protein
MTNAMTFVTGCTCVCGGGGWVLSECSAILSIQVVLRSSIASSAEEAWALRAEQDHIMDIRGTTGAIRQAGSSAEASLKGKTFASQEACTASATIAVQNAISDVLDSALAESNRFWDKSDLHSYPSPNRRP